MHIWNIFFKMLNFKLSVDVETSPNEVMDTKMSYCYQLKNLFLYMNSNSCSHLYNYVLSQHGKYSFTLNILFISLGIQGD